jgi:hypothetical protein
MALITALGAAHKVHLIKSTQIADLLKAPRRYHKQLMDKQ